MSVTGVLNGQLGAPEFVSGEILIGFEDEVANIFQNHGARTALEAAGGQLAALGLHAPDVLFATPGAADRSARLATQWQLPAGADVVETLAQLSSRPGVAYAEPNYIYSIATTPDDPQFGALWGLHNTGQTGGTPDADIDAPEAWDVTTGGLDVVAGVIDTGVDYTHPDLYRNIWLNQDEIPVGLGVTDTDSDGLVTFRDLNNPANAGFVSDFNGTGYIDGGDLLADPTWADGVDTDGNSYVDDFLGWDFVNNDNDPFDDNNHGSHVAGTIGATGANGTGVVGVNWDVRIMGLKFLADCGGGSTDNAIGAVNYATAAANSGVNVRLTNNSWSGGFFSNSLHDAIAASGAANMLFVAAAGNANNNNDTSPCYPSSYDLDNVIAVASTDHNDAKASLSSFGLTSVDLAAPGVSVVSTTPGNTYQSFGGTSMAAPHVSGVAALAWSIAGGAGYATIRDAILDSVDPVASMSGISVTGGRLNALAALQEVAMLVQGSDPASGQTVVSPTPAPADFTVDFSFPYDPGTVQAGDLRVNGLAANDMTLDDPDTITFHFRDGSNNPLSPVSSQGMQTMSMVDGAVAASAAGLPTGIDPALQAWTAPFRWDAALMQVTATDPADGSTLALPFHTLPATSTAVASLAGMNGVNGGWAILYGDNPLSPDGLNLAVEEDQLFDTERSHTTEQAAFAVFENSGAITPFLETTVVAGVTDVWMPVTLAQSYSSMVVVATPNYDGASPPLVTRLRNASGGSLEIKVQRADGLTDPVSAVDVHLLVVEEGVYTEAVDGITMEAVIHHSTVTDHAGDGNVHWLGENRTYSNLYGTPVVLGQVMTANDSRFSAFWARGADPTEPPSGTDLYVGKHVGEDPDTARLDETIGYVVIEGGNGTLGTTQYVARLGPNTIQGVHDSAPFNYSLPSTSLLVHFNETFDTASLGPDDLVLSEGLVVAAAVVDADSALYTLTDIVSDGILTVELPAGALVDLYGNPIDAYSGSFEIDWTTDVPYPVPLSAERPLGSLIHEGSHSALISAGDTDSFTIDLTPNHSITVVVDPEAGLQPTVELFDPSGVLVGSATAAAAGQDTLLQSVSIASGGSYRIAVTGAGGTTGGYAVRVVLNAAVEEEAHDGPGNDHLATAQNIDGSFLALAGAADRGALSGRAASVLGPATSYASSDVGQKIRAPKTITSTLSVPDSLTVGDVNVELDINHTRDADLDVFLISPAGTRVELFTGVGGSGADFTNTCFDDEAGTPITAGTPPFTGSFQPEGFLGDFDGEDAQGSWTLEVTDTATQESGTLNGWSLELAEAPLTTDYYKLTLEAGQRATIALSTTSSGGVELQLQDAGGITLATGAGTAANADRVIDDFVAPATDTYFVQVLANVDYRFVVTRDGAFDLEDNDDFASAQDLAGHEAVLGNIGSNYTVTSGPLNRLDAEAEAASLGGHLATIGDQAEQDLLNEITGNGLYWIGFTDQDQEGTWVWVTGESVTYTNWSSGEPNNAGGDEHFAFTSVTGWNDVDQNEVHPGIIEVPDHDFYQLALSAGDNLNLATVTPAGSPGAILNIFDPRIRLYDSSLALVAEDDNSATDGRNAELTFLVPSGGAGTYYIEVLPTDVPGAGISGDYILHIGATLPPPSLSINDVTRAEGDAGATVFTFTVTRSGDTSATTMVNYATADGSAELTDNDYEQAGGQLTFLAGETSETILITVNGDTNGEADETFFVNLSGAVGATIDDGQGVGTILDDDSSTGANDIYVWDIAFDSKTRGGGSKHDERIVVTVRRDADADGADADDVSVAGATLTVEVSTDPTDPGSVIATLSGTTDAAGVFTSGWLRDLDDGTYTAEVTDLTHATFTWNGALDPTANDGDADGDGLPDEQRSIPQGAAASFFSLLASTDSEVERTKGGGYPKDLSAEASLATDRLFASSALGVDFADPLVGDRLFPASPKKHPKHSAVDLALEEITADPFQQELVEGLAVALV